MRQEAAIESILDLNSTNVWKLTEQDIKKAWDAEKEEGSFATSEDKLLNIIRLSFDVVHYNPADPREKAKYENGEWSTFQHCNEKRGWVAVRKKYITRLTDLSYENIHHITVSTLLELIANNFGGGWDSIALSMKDIILSGFDISTTTLPASRIHAPGGTLERKVAQGFEVLEITKGTWVEAIFAKKKDPIEKVHSALNDREYDEDGNLISSKSEMDINDENDDDITENDDTYFSSLTPEAATDDLEEEGLSIEDVEEEE